MTLLQGKYIIDAVMRDRAPMDLEPLAKSKLLRSVLERIGERDDFFESENSSMGTIYKFRAHVFSEAELADYKNRVITEFMADTGALATRPTKKELDRLEDSND